MPRYRRPAGSGLAMAAAAVAATMLPWSLLALASAAIDPDVAKCYYPDGSLAPGDTPCDITANGTTTQAGCCGDGYACMSNKMCKATGDEVQKSGATLFVRGSCTDQEWRSNSCPKFCINPDDPFNDFMAGGCGIASCGGDGTIFHCVDNAPADCDSGTNVLVFNEAPTAITTIGVVPTGTTRSMSATSTPSTTGSTPGKDDDASSGHGNSSSSGSTVGIAVGSAVGAIGLIAAAIAAFLLLRRRKRTRPQNQSPTVAGLSPSMDPGASPPGGAAPSMSEMSAPGQNSPSALGISTYRGGVSVGSPLTGQAPSTPSWSMHSAPGVPGYSESINMMSPDKAPFYSPMTPDQQQQHMYYQWQQQQYMAQQQQHHQQQPPPLPPLPQEIYSNERHELQDSQRVELP